MIVIIDQLDFSQKINIEVSRQIHGNILHRAEKDSLYAAANIPLIGQVYEEAFKKYLDLSMILEENKENIARIQADDHNDVDRYYEILLIDGG